MKKTIRKIGVAAVIVLTSGFLVNAMSVSKPDNNIYEQADAQAAIAESTTEHHKGSFESDYRVYALDIPENLTSQVSPCRSKTLTYTSAPIVSLR